MSVLSHPLWSKLVHHLVVVRGDVTRAAFEQIDLALFDEVRWWIAPCLACSRPTFPFRVLVQLEGRSGPVDAVYQPYCSPLALRACEAHLRVTHELGKLAMIAAGKNIPDPDSSHSYLR